MIKNILNNLKYRSLFVNSKTSYNIINKFAMALTDIPTKMNIDEYITTRKIQLPSNNIEANKLKQQLQSFFNYLNKEPKTLVFPKKVMINFFLWHDFIPVDESGRAIERQVNIDNFPEYFIYNSKRKLPSDFNQIVPNVIYKIKVYTPSDSEYQWLHRFKLDSYCFCQKK